MRNSGIWRDKMQRPAIVAVGYNRPEALKRLLGSIESAEYGSDDSPTLIISIDKSDTDEVVRVAKDFEYTHGEKIVMDRSARLGLREHVLACGDLTEEYGSIIVLEDDLFVARGFYGFACAALELSEKDDRIGSVSIYDHHFNVHAREPFDAIDDGYDNYYLQIASSWGQAYTKKQWKDFRVWYDANKDRDLAGPLVPSNISGWTAKSWLKYYIVYLIETNKYCIYPRGSFTTNFGDAGTHFEKKDTDLQVALSGRGRQASYDLSLPDESRAVYDPFFEAVRISGEGIEADKTIVDLYGTKPVPDIAKVLSAGYVLTPACLPFKVIKSYGRLMRPLDANIVHNIGGEDIYLYDMSQKALAPKPAIPAIRFLYDYKGLSAARMIEIIKYRIREKFGGR